MEGNDPISISFLLDTNAPDLMQGISEGIADLAPSFLTARDHVSIYVMGCGLTRSLNDVPANGGELEGWSGRGVEIVDDTPGEGREL